MNYGKILVALDRSPQSKPILERALKLARQNEAAVMVFHCLAFEGRSSADMLGAGFASSSRQMQAQWDKEYQEVREWLERCCQMATERGVSAQWQLKVGDPGSAIRDCAKAWQADLVVLGRHGRRGLAEVFLGSVSNYVIHYVPCSVLVVQGIPATEESAQGMK